MYGLYRIAKRDASTPGENVPLRDLILVPSIIDYIMTNIRKAAFIAQHALSLNVSILLLK